MNGSKHGQTTALYPLRYYKAEAITPAILTENNCTHDIIIRVVSALLYLSILEYEEANIFAMVDFILFKDWVGIVFDPYSS